jgi:hypothetical protein
VESIIGKLEGKIQKIYMRRKLFKKIIGKQEKVGL